MHQQAHKPVSDPCPFLGLRPFFEEDARWFHGRDDQTDELLRRLGRSRFLAVVGTSGSGKSSLVRAGLVPSLKRGYMPSSGAHWKVATMRPGGDPYGALDEALAEEDVLGADEKGLETLKRSSLGLVEAARDRLGPEDSLLVVVDQFEEIFRFKKETEGADDEADAFVRMLLAAAEQEEASIYVVLTMRSDYLGDCAVFRGLPQALNGAQYLVPVMTREQLREAIEEPIAARGAAIAPELVQRLLNDVGHGLEQELDQLPVLQHALMRTWECAKGAERIELKHYHAVGEMAGALNQHANELYEQLDEEEKLIAKRLFQRLSEKESEGRDIRRPTRLDELCAVAGAAPDQAFADRVQDFWDRRPKIEGDSTADPRESLSRLWAQFESWDSPKATASPRNKLLAAIEHFRPFLAAPNAPKIKDDSIIDITHEALIRQWKQLQRWAKDEAHSARYYVRLVDDAVGDRSPWSGQNLSEAARLKKVEAWNDAWGRRYCPGSETYSQTEAFLAKSRWRRFQVRLGFTAVAVAIIASPFLYLNYLERVATIEAQAEAAEERANSLESERETLQTQIASAQENKARLEQLEREAREQGQAELADRLEQQAGDYQQQISQSEGKLGDLNTQLANAQQGLTSTRSELAKLTEQYRQVTRERDQLERERDVLREELKESNQLRSTIASLRGQLAEYTTPSPEFVLRLKEIAVIEDGSGGPTGWVFQIHADGSPLFFLPKYDYDDKAEPIHLVSGQQSIRTADGRQITKLAVEGQRTFGNDTVRGQGSINASTGEAEIDVRNGDPKDGSFVFRFEMTRHVVPDASPSSVR